MGHSEQGNPPPTRPSLLSNTESKTTTGVNILSGLEGLGKAKPSAQFPPKKIRSLSIFVILLASGVAALMYLQDSTSSPPIVSSTSKTGTALSPAVALNSEATTASVNPPPDQLAQASSGTAGSLVDSASEKNSAAVANIVDEALEKTGAKNSEHPFSTMVNNEKSETKTSSSAISKVSVPAKKHLTATPSTSTKVASAADQQHSLTPAKNLIASSAESKKEAPQKSKTSNGADSDIALISALISRDNDNHKVKPDKHTQDIVERKPGDKTKNLLARCKNLGGLEADLCRSRICSGPWANESACLAPITTESSVTTNTAEVAIKKM